MLKAISSRQVVFKPPNLFLACKKQSVLSLYFFVASPYFAYYLINTPPLVLSHQTYSRWPSKNVSSNAFLWGGSSGADSSSSSGDVQKEFVALYLSAAVASSICTYTSKQISNTHACAQTTPPRTPPRRPTRTAVSTRRKRSALFPLRAWTPSFSATKGSPRSTTTRPLR